MPASGITSITSVDPSSYWEKNPFAMDRSSETMVKIGSISKCFFVFAFAAGVAAGYIGVSGFTAVPIVSGFTAAPIAIVGVFSACAITAFAIYYLNLERFEPTKKISQEQIKENRAKVNDSDTASLVEAVNQNTNKLSYLGIHGFRSKVGVSGLCRLNDKKLSGYRQELEEYLMTCPIAEFNSYAVDFEILKINKMQVLRKRWNAMPFSDILTKESVSFYSHRFFFEPGEWTNKAIDFLKDKKVIQAMAHYPGLFIYGIINPETPYLKSTVKGTLAEEISSYKNFALLMENNICAEGLKHGFIDRENSHLRKLALEFINSNLVALTSSDPSENIHKIYSFIQSKELCPSEILNEFTNALGELDDEYDKSLKNIDASYAQEYKKEQSNVKNLLQQEVEICKQKLDAANKKVTETQNKIRECSENQERFNNLINKKEVIRGSMEKISHELDNMETNNPDRKSLIEQHQQKKSELTNVDNQINSIKRKQNSLRLSYDSKEVDDSLKSAQAEALNCENKYKIAEAELKNDLEAKINEIVDAKINKQKSDAECIYRSQRDKIISSYKQIIENEIKKISPTVLQ